LHKKKAWQDKGSNGAKFLAAAAAAAAAKDRNN
jgi:hypothetical protein